MINIKKNILIILILFCSRFICAAQEITTDGDFSDWLDKPKIETQEIAGPDTKAEENGEIPAAEIEIEIEIEGNEDIAPDKGDDGPKYKITQLSWNMSEDFDVLYIALRLSHGKNTQSTAVTCELITDYGSFEAVTNYDLNDASVFTVIKDSDIVSSEGSCSEINKQTTFLEYGIPVGQLIQDMGWGFEIKMRVHTEDDTEPKKGYIIISTIGSGPVIGVMIAGVIAVGGFYLMKRKKRI